MLAVHWGMVDEQLVAAARSHKLRVFGWTANAVSMIDPLIRAGVAAIVTDQVRARLAARLVHMLTMRVPMLAADARAGASSGFARAVRRMTPLFCDHTHTHAAASVSHHLLVRAVAHQRQQDLLAHQAAPHGVNHRDGQIQPHRVVCAHGNASDASLHA